MTDSGGHFEPAGRSARADRQRRRNEIAVLVAEQGRVTIDEIRERFGVSGGTARSDLDALSLNGSLVRSYGGAVALDGPMNGKIQAAPPVSEVSDEQRRLARAAIALMGPQETIMLGSGGTAEEMARLLRDEGTSDVTVITYSLPVAGFLSDSPRVSLVMLGGVYRMSLRSILGPHAEHMMKSLHAGHCFLNPSGLSSTNGVTGIDIMEANLNQRMIEAASQITLLAELASFGRRMLSLVASTDDIDRIICDKEVPGTEVAAFRARGIEVVLV